MLWPNAHLKCGLKLDFMMQIYLIIILKLKIICNKLLGANVTVLPYKKSHLK